MTAVKSPSSLKVQNGDIASFPNRDAKGHNAPLWFGWLSPDAAIIHRAAEMEAPETRGSDRVAIYFTDELPRRPGRQSCGPVGLYRTGYLPSSIDELSTSKVAYAKTGSRSNPMEKTNEPD